MLVDTNTSLRLCTNVVSLIPLFVLLAACVSGVMGWVDRSVNANNIMFIVVFVAISFFSVCKIMHIIYVPQS